MVLKKKIAAVVIAATLSTSMISYLPAYAVGSSTLSNDSAVATTPSETENVTATANDSTPDADAATVAPEESPANTENNQQQTEDPKDSSEEQGQSNDSTEKTETQIPDSSQAQDVGNTELINDDGSAANAKTVKEISNDKKRLQKIVNCAFGVIMGTILFCLVRVLLFAIRSHK